VAGKAPGQERHATVGVVYLAWHALGPASFQRFADSYRRQPAGCSHDLIVIYAGFDQQQSLHEAVSIFRDLPHIALEMPEIRQDIGYYLETSQRVPHDYLCFLNTYTELSVPNWLSALRTHAVRDSTGIAGATGSYESLFDSMGLYQKISWLCHMSGNRVSPAAARYYDFYLKQNCPLAVVEPSVLLPPRGIDRWRSQAIHFMKQRELDFEFQTLWDKLTGPDMPFGEYGRFPAFPNPHIRTNGFMLRRSHLARFTSSQVETKFDACAFESGADSLTAQLRRDGLAAIVVASDGEGYDTPSWARSNTFRLGDQSGLILTDNRSRDVAQMTPTERAVHVRITWGDYIKQVECMDLPDFGYKFAKRSLNPHRARPAPVYRPLTSDPTYIGCRLALELMRFAAPVVLPKQVKPLLVRKTRASARRMIRGALPAFRRLDDRAAAYAHTIKHLEAEIAGLHERIRALEVENTKLQ
jgi:hypothetical protein